MDFTPKKNSSNLIISYNKQISKLKQSIESGRFVQWSYQKKQYFISRILHLLKLLRSRGVRVAGTLGIAILGSLSLSAQPNAPFAMECAVSPFDGLDLIPFIEPDGDEGGGLFSRQVVSGDLDDDGDEDFLVISYDINEGYYLQYFDNVGGAFVELIDDDNPLEIFNDEFSGGVGFPPIFNFTLGDATLNGRLDLVFGASKGDVICFANTETGFEEPENKDITAMNDSPFSSVNLANIDGDCENELIVTPSIDGPGGQDGSPSVGIVVFDEVEGEFVESPAMSSMFVNVVLSEDDFVIPYFFDIDGDGIDELIIVAIEEFDGGGTTIDLYNKEEGTYVLSGVNPFSDLEGGGEGDLSVPLFDFGDLDGNGNLNLYLGFKSDNVDIADELFCFDSAITIAPACARPPGPGGAVPTLSEWGMIILSLVFFIFGIAGIKERNATKVKVLKVKS